VRVTPPPTFRCHAVGAITINVRRRADPTNTGMVRQRFEAEVKRRFARLIRAMMEHLADPETLAAQPMGMLQTQADGSAFGGEVFDPEGRFLFPRSSDRAAEFMRWLRRQARRDVLSIVEGANVSASAATAWSNVYIDTAYQRGIRQAGANLKRGGAKVEQSWIRDAFNRPVHADRVGLIYSRTFTELYDVTEVMAQRMGEVLARGMAEGKNPITIARELRDRVERIGITRARLIARTEVIAAHAEATLNSYTEAGIAGVQVEAEWSTAGDERVCPECEGMEGKLFTIDEARGMIPAHPNCRCAFLPKVLEASGLVLNWKHHAPGTRNAQRRRLTDPARAARRPHAHHSACGHRGGGRAEWGTAHR
jgi:SPP1 gp7 family putative phage head morphogenesis protein